MTPAFLLRQITIRRRYRHSFGYGYCYYRNNTSWNHKCQEIFSPSIKGCQQKDAYYCNFFDVFVKCVRTYAKYFFRRSFFSAFQFDSLISKQLTPKKVSRKKYKQCINHGDGLHIALVSIRAWKSKPTGIEE